MMDKNEAYIAVDWGTTNRRAYALDPDGRVTDGFEDEGGIMAVPQGGFEAAAGAIVDRLGRRPMLMAGMVGSNRGWREAPYVSCPAGPAELAAAVLWIEPGGLGGGRLGIIPGVSQSGAAGADVMRGEEVQAFGALAAGLVSPDSLICHPGTHAKWIIMHDGRIEAFRTMMTGELFGLLRKHSILADQLTGEVAPGPSFLDGARHGLEGAELLASLFAIRARHLLVEPGGADACYASGLLIGCDIRTGLRFDEGAGPIALIGRADLCALYAAALAAAGRETIEVDGAAAFLAGIHKLREML